jgi:hypothetical protein
MRIRRMQRMQEQLQLRQNDKASAFFGIRRIEPFVAHPNKKAVIRGLSVPSALSGRGTRPPVLAPQSSSSVSRSAAEVFAVALASAPSVSSV